MRLGADLVSAFGLLTRLPLPKGIQGSAMGQGVWAWPLVGVVVGLFSGGVYWLAVHAGLSPWIAGLLAVLTMIAVTGGLHEDGLADTADGMGGGTPERRLAIMKDSRIGSYGVLALIGSVGLRAGAVAQLADPHLAVPALMLAAMAGRAAMPGVLFLSGPARPGGLGASLGDLPPARVYAGWGIAAVLSLLLTGLHATALAAAVAILVGLLMARFGRRALGGYTGDTLGAVAQLVEVAVLLTLAARFG